MTPHDNWIKPLLAAAIALLAAPALAQVPKDCRPVRPSYVHLVTSEQALGAWWFCDISKTTYWWGGIERGAITDHTAAAVRAYALSGSQAIFNEAPTLPESAPVFTELRATIRKEIASFVPTFVVPKTGTTATEQPVYAISSANVRTTSSNMRVGVGTQCNCFAAHVIEGSTLYCSVAPQLVAQCVEKSP